MSFVDLKNAIINDRATHPERTNANLERVFEVLENVLNSYAGEYIAQIKTLVGSDDIREELTSSDAEGIAKVLDSPALSKSEHESIIAQLEYSEISTAEAIEVHKKYKIPVSHLETDIIPIKGDGCWVMDTKGKWYLDLDSNYSATNLGMANPEIAKGLYNQAELLISMKEDRVQIARTRFMKNISHMLPEGLNHFYWQNSGGEAVDKALKVAKAYTGTRDVIAFKGSFHGRTHGAVAVTWNEAYRKPFGLDNEDWVHFADFNDIESVEALLDETCAKIVIMELVQGEEAGNLPAEQAFVGQLWPLVHAKGGVIIVDEVQSGFGRTAMKEGDWFACMSYGVVPDIMTIGKSFGGGYPVTAVLTNEKISEAMQGGYDGSTFGGNPMAMTAALIATRQMFEQDVTGNVVKRSAQLKAGLHKLQTKYSLIDDIRIHGLMVAFSVGSAENVQKIQDGLRAEGIKASLSSGKYVRFLPPTVITEGEMALVLEKLDKVIGQI